MTQDTAGRVPALAAAKYDERGWMFFNWWSWCTSSNSGSGFQMPGVW